MNEPDVPAGHVRALIERPHNEVLEEAARALLAGRDASTIMHAYFGIAAEAGFRTRSDIWCYPDRRWR